MVTKQNVSNGMPQELALGGVGMKSHHRRAFTLTELLVAIAIIVALLAVLLPGVQMAREAGRRMACKHNLKEISLAVQSYETIQNKLPQAGLHGTGELTWVVRLLPHMQQEKLATLFGDLRLEHGFFKAPAEAQHARLPAFSCPSRRDSDIGEPMQRDDKSGGQLEAQGTVGDYAACYGPSIPSSLPNSTFGAFIYAMDNGGIRGLHLDPTTRLFEGKGAVIRLTDIEDGSGLTFFFGEKYVPDKTHGKWLYGDGSLYCDDHYFFNGRIAGPGFPIASLTKETVPTTGNYVWQFGGPHPNICLFAMGDGRVEAISVTTNTEVLGRLANRLDGKMVNIP